MNHVTYEFVISQYCTHRWRGIGRTRSDVSSVYVPASGICIFSCVAACCDVLQCIAVIAVVAVPCSVLQCIVACCGIGRTKLDVRN